VKFSCERCGKKYATAETPAPGRVYKIKCKACGHLMVVKARPAGVEAAPPPPLPPPGPEVASAAIRDVAPEARAAEPGAPRAPQLSDATQEISMAGVSAAPAEEQPAAPREDAGYVDLFADAPRQDQAKAAEDAFVAAAGAPPAEGHGAAAAAPDPFATLREELAALPPPPALPVPRAEAAPPATPSIPAIPKPAPQQKSALPLVLIGAGALVLVGILAFVLLGGAPGP
jgi:DNA-directed RNA polymerase subunit RPC12/RpoP